MPYVYSTDPNARLYHVGTRSALLCGVILRHEAVSEDRPPGRTPCASCAIRSEVKEPKRLNLRDEVVRDLCSRGLTVAAIARALGVGHRTASRWVTEARDRAGFGSRAEWLTDAARRAALEDGVARAD